jgi:hypothetical protein
MYGCHVVEPNDDGADLGVVFFHNAGYSTACGHGNDRARHVGSRLWGLRATGGLEPRGGRRPLRPPRDVGPRGERPRALRALPQRPVVRLGRGVELGGARSTSRSAARSTRRSRSASTRRSFHGSSSWA